MAETVRKIDYYYVSTSNKPGEAARALSLLYQAGVNLLAFSGFPQGARKSQLDFVPEDPAVFAKAARKAGLKLSKKKSGFLILGDDQPGAAAQLTGKLAAAGINITAVQAITAGSGRYAAILWVKAADIRKAAKALSPG
jgi:hypothetical protein